MKRQSQPVRGTIQRNRPVFFGCDEINDPVTGHVRFSRPLRSPGSATPHFRVAVELSDGRAAIGYWTPGRPVELT
ncbi:hypothetical protein V6617_10270 [Pelagibacterium nitratireducens]|uniref:Uncharacterized protein n=1 Tax=Pelagibacterium nitratireducens TaxID=1046114 RepID=A0ABZ2I1H8_9HYPH